jgi:tripartite-type tricarboxylate transporter receptor subunit TctC
MMSFTRRAAALLAAAGLAASSMLAQGQELSGKPIRIIVGFSAGGATDAIARVYGEKLSQLLKAPVLIENRPGAAQITAIKTMLAAPADGQTLYLGTGSSLAQGPGMRKDLPYDPLKDFALVALVATTPGVIIVSPNLPVRDVRELLAYSRAHPDAITYGSAGVGTASHLQTEFFMSLTGMHWTHVPYKSDGEVVREVSEGRLQISISTTQQAMPLVKAGRLKALAVTTTRPLSYLPNVPTLPQVQVKGLDGIEPYTFYGLVGPAGMPAAAVARLNEAINKISAMPDVASHLTNLLFADPETSTPTSFRAFMEKDIAKWKAVGTNVKLPE